MVALPDRVHGFARRDVRPAAASATFAAWGDPPITLTCGVPRPAALRAESTLLDVDGVSWFSEPLPRGTRFTTTTFAVNIRVEVPEDYTTPTDALTDLASAVRGLPSA
jgi:hypothetical protein